MFRAIVPAALLLLTAASECFEKHAVYAARELPWGIDYVNDQMVVTKPAVEIGSLSDDLSKLNSFAVQDYGQIRLAKIDWCTTEEDNRGRISSIRASVILQEANENKRGYF